MRQTGESKTVELLHDRNPSLSKRSLSLISTERKQSTSIESSHSNGQSLAETQVASKAPSLTLNIEGALPTKAEVIYLMCWGVAIQVSIFVVNALVVYRWRWLRGGSTVATYGYPVWAAGTISISLGVFICGHLVESRATTKEFQAEGELKNRYVIRLQSKLPNLNLPAYALIQDRAGLPIKVCRLDDSLTDEPGLLTKRKLYTVFGTLLTLSGFICQNIGTRELHWSAGVLQLGATVLVTVIRAGARRHVGKLPQPYPLRLCNGTEASCLSLLLEEGREAPPQAPVSFKAKLRSVIAVISPERRSSKTHLDMEKRVGDPKIIKESCHMIIERNNLTNTSLLPLGGDKMFARIRPSISEPREDLTDDGQRKLSRILNMCAVLREYEPGKEEIANIASGLCNAIREVLLAVNCEGLRWYGCMALARSSAEEPGFGQCVPIQLYSSRTGRYVPGDATRNMADETPKRIQAMISLTYHQFIHPGASIERAPTMSKTMRVFRQCEDEEACEKERKKLEKWFGTSVEVGYGWAFGIWNRVDGRWSWTSNRSFVEGNYTTFGSQFRLDKFPQNPWDP